MALQISRKYDFKPGTKIYSAQMDEELNQLVEAHNSVVTDKADKTGVLEKTNTEVFTPTENYQPATKKYVDESIGAVVLGQLPDGSVTKAKLSETVQASINKADGSVQQTDKATTEEADAGVEDSHFMTPSKVMKVVKDHDYQVGDVLTTKRTNLGDDWLLCNGEQFDDTVYPDLAAMYTKTNVLRKVYSYSNVKVKYLNGCFFAWAANVDMGATITIRYTQTPKVSASWQTISITTSNTYNAVNDVCFGNGYYVLSGYCVKSGTAYTATWYSTTPNGVFAEVTISGYQSTLTRVSYANSKFFLVCASNYSGFVRVYTSTTPTSWGSGVSINSPSGSQYSWGAAITEVIYFNSKYIFYGRGNDSTTPYVFCATSSDGTTWANSVSVVNGDYSYPSEIFIYGGALYVTSGEYKSYGLIKTTTGYSGWTVPRSQMILSIFQGKNYSGILYKQEAAATSGTIYLAIYATMDDLLANTNSLATIPLFTSNTAAINVTQFMPYTEGVDMVVGVPVSSLPGVYASLIGNDPYGVVTPTLTDTGVYNYIRGKTS